MSADEPTTQELKTIFAERAAEEAERADDAAGEPERRTHARRFEKASYLEEKLAEKAESESAED